MGSSFFLLCLFSVIRAISAIELVNLEASTLDLALASSKYAAVLFADKSETGLDLTIVWEKAASLIDDLHDDAIMAMVDGTDLELKELVDAYGIVVPSIRIFRRSVMGDYRGPSKGGKAQDIANYIKEDAMPSVKLLMNSVEFREALAGETSSTSPKKQTTVVIGIFNVEDLREEQTDSYSVSSWGQFQAAADSLRGHSVFYATSSSDVIATFKLGQSDLPAVYLIADEKNKIIPFNGDILEKGLAEWVLRHSTPATGELTLASPDGELYATQFFSSKKLKFILFLRSSDLMQDNAAAGEYSSENVPSAISEWLAVAELFKGQALFSYMIDGAVPDVATYFEMNVVQDSPMIVAHDPSHDHRFKSQRLVGKHKDSLVGFVKGVISGGVSKMLKSEPIPSTAQLAKLPKSSVVYAVGSTVIDIVSEPEKDVLLMVTSPKCANCRKLAPTFDILAKAVQGESRIVVAKIDGINNDLPSSWGIRNYPTLLWFPALDKPYGSDAVPVPRSYWDAGLSLHELVSFVQRKGSFDLNSLRVATSEQLGSLLGEEEAIRARYDELDRLDRRNEGRQVLDNVIFDYIHGEIVFDGKRWHVVVGGLVSVYAAILTLLYLSRSLEESAAKKIGKARIAREVSATAAGSDRKKDQ